MIMLATDEHSLRMTLGRTTLRSNNTSQHQPEQHELTDLESLFCQNVIIRNCPRAFIEVLLSIVVFTKNIQTVTPPLCSLYANSTSFQSTILREKHSKFVGVHLYAHSCRCSPRFSLSIDGTSTRNRH